MSPSHGDKSLVTGGCPPVTSCGISSRFQLLSPTSGQVAHVLLTRPPLSQVPFRRISKENASFDLHVLGTPPAFVLSQDQTLEFNLSAPLSAVAHFYSLGRVSFASVILDLSIGIDLACLLMHYIVFKVLRCSVLRDSFVSISQLIRFVNTFFSLFLKFFSTPISCVSPVLTPLFRRERRLSYSSPTPLVNPFFHKNQNIF